MLKGNGFAEAWPKIWPLLLFLLAVATLAVMRYQRTLGDRSQPDHCRRQATGGPAQAGLRAGTGATPTAAR